MRTLSAGLAAHVADSTTTLCNMLRLELVDGTTIGLTDHDNDLTFDGGLGSLLYQSGEGIIPSDVALSIGLEVDNCEIVVPLGTIITAEAIVGKRFTRARVRLFQVNWDNLGQGAAKILWGKVADARIEGGRAIFEIRSSAEAYNQVVGNVFQNKCRVTFGGVLCGVVRTEFDTTITAATSSFQFTVDVTGIPAIPFNYGAVGFTSGALLGTQEVEVFSFDQATGVIELYYPLADVPEVGAALTIFNGCSKAKGRISDPVDLPTCLFYENVLRFRGEDQVPGDDTYMKMSVPGSGGA